MGKVRHPSTLDHSPETLHKLASVALDLSHEVEGQFDNLQDIANLLHDWASLQAGWALIDVDGNSHPVPIGG